MCTSMIASGSERMKENLLQTKSLAFSVHIVGLYRYLTEQKKEYILSKQILRSGTSIGANIHEANYGHSKADFTAKHCSQGDRRDRILAATAYSDQLFR